MHLQSEIGGTSNEDSYFTSCSRAGFWLASPAIAAPPSYGVSILDVRGNSDNSMPHQDMVIYNKNNGLTSYIVHSSPSEKIRDNISNFSSPTFSPDGKFLYFTTITEKGHRSAIQRLDMISGSIEFFSSGKVMSVIRKGSLKSCIVVGQPVKSNNGSPESSTFEVIVNENGDVVGSKQDLIAFM